MAFESIDQLARRLAESVPKGLRSVKDDLEKNFQSVLRSGLGKLDLVTREDFEVQEALLVRTRQKLEALEERLISIEIEKTTKKKKKSAKLQDKRKKMSEKEYLMKDNAKETLFEMLDKESLKQEEPNF